MGRRGSRERRVERDDLTLAAQEQSRATERDDESVSEPVARARSLSSVEEAARLYADWASTYDDDVFGELGFTGSARIAELLVSFLPDLHEPVVDLGCGTGAVGRRLAQLGVTTIDGVDLSPEMIAIAARTGAYRRLTAADLNDLPNGANATYTASVSAGTFTTGHVGPGVVPRLVELLRPDGFVAWVIAADVWPRFEPVLAMQGLNVLHQAIEPIRRNAPPEAVMFVAQVSADGHLKR
jgi:predicted TPR repeat methyltransferase